MVVADRSCRRIVFVINCAWYILRDSNPYLSITIMIEALPIELKMYIKKGLAYQPIVGDFSHRVSSTSVTNLTSDSALLWRVLNLDAMHNPQCGFYGLFWLGIPSPKPKSVSAVTQVKPDRTIGVCILPRLLFETHRFIPPWHSKSTCISLRSRPTLLPQPALELATLRQK